MEKCLIEKRANNVEYGIRKMIDRYLFLRNKINSSCAYSKSETEERIKLIEERILLEGYLRLLDIQSFEIKGDYVVFNLN